MKSKIKLILIFLLVNAIVVTQAQAMTVVSDGVIVRSATTQGNENRLAGIVSKISDGEIVINAITYDFSTKQAKIYDLNGHLNQSAMIKIGMFVSILVGNDKSKPSVLEIRLVRK